MSIYLMVPWWAWAYLLFVLTMFIVSLFSEKLRSRHEICASACSLFSICAFVIAFFNPLLFQLLGFMVIPMTMMGIYWEFTRAVHETETAEIELSRVSDLGDAERVALLNVAIGFNALIVVPGYVMGTILSFYAVRSVFGA